MRSVARRAAREFGVSRHFDVDLVEPFVGQGASWLVALLGAKNVAAKCGGGGEQSESRAEAFESGRVAGLFATDFGLLQAGLPHIGQRWWRRFGAA